MKLNLAMISIYEYNQIPVEFAISIGNLKSKHRFFQHFLKSEITVLNVLNECSHKASVFVFGLFNCDNNIGFFVNACTASNWRALSIHRAFFKKRNNIFQNRFFFAHTHSIHPSCLRSQNAFYFASYHLSEKLDIVWYLREHVLTYSMHKVVKNLIVFSLNLSNNPNCEEDVFWSFNSGHKKNVRL